MLLKEYTSKTFFKVEFLTDEKIASELAEKIEAAESKADEIEMEAMDAENVEAEEQPQEQKGEKKRGPIGQLIDKMRERRKILLDKIEEIKKLRDTYKRMSRNSVKALIKKKERLEFKIATEAITLDKERALMKVIKALDEQIKAAQSKEAERKKVKDAIKALDAEIEALKNELDEMKLELLKLKEERKKRRAKKRPKNVPVNKQPSMPKKSKEPVVTLEDIAIIRKKE